MQASDLYLTTNKCIFLLLCNYTDSFLFALGNPLFFLSIVTGSLILENESVMSHK